MIVTVTPNPALDLTWHVASIVAGGTHRTDAGRVRAGGKGLNVARVAQAQGADVVAVTRRGGGNPAGVARAATGDETAVRIWNEALDALALSIAQLTAVIAPQAVVIGGGLSRAGGALFDELRTRLADRLSFPRIPELVPAELSGNAGILGSALRARQAAEGRA